MGYPVRGSADYFAPGTWNIACSMCGRKRKATELVKNWQGMYRCPEHDEPRQPQDFVRNIKDVMTVPYALEETSNYVTYSGPTFPLNIQGPIYFAVAQNYHPVALFPTWVTPTGYVWSWASGGATISIAFPFTASPTLSSVVNGSSGVLQVVVTNSLGLTATARVQAFVGKYFGSLFAGQHGLAIGFTLGSFGTMTPATDANGYGINQLQYVTSTGAISLTINSTVALLQNYFATLLIGGNSLLSVSATFSSSGSGSFWQNTWTWTPSGFPIAIGTTYPVEYY